jgi:hypothetical protein
MIYLLPTVPGKPRSFKLLLILLLIWLKSRTFPYVISYSSLAMSLLDVTFDDFDPVLVYSNPADWMTPNPQVRANHLLVWHILANQGESHY